LKRRNLEIGTAAFVGLIALASVILTGVGATGFPFGSTLAAFMSVVASAVILAWIVFDDANKNGAGLAWLAGVIAAVVLGLGSMADYLLWFSDSRLWTVVCHLLAVVLVAVAAWRGGWAGGLRASLSGHLIATPFLLMVFWWNLGVPLQAAVFQAAGVLDSYAVSKGTFFAPWVRGAFLWAVLPRTLGAMVLGFGLGYGLNWLVKNKKFPAWKTTAAEKVTPKKTVPKKTKGLFKRV